MSASSSQQLLWRATFIDDWADSCVDQPQLSRSHSEPLPLRPSVAHELFRAEREYLETLPARVRGLQGQGVSAVDVEGYKSEGSLSHNCGREGSGDSDDRASLCSTSVDGLPYGASGSASLGSASTAPSASLTRASRGCGQLLHGGLEASRVSHGPQPGTAAIHAGSLGLPGDLTAPERREPVTVALAIMQGLPEQLADDLQQQGLRLIGDVQKQVSLICEDIMSGANASQEHAQSAVEEIGAIPGLVMASLRNGAVRTRQSLESHLSAVEKDVRSQSGGCGRAEELARAACSLPEQIQQLTCQEAEAVLQESKALAERQVCRARTSLPESSALDEGGDRLVSAVLAVPPSALATSAAAAAKQTVGQAVTAAEGGVPALQHAANNQVVAANLLRAKVECAPEAAPGSLHLTNAGSYGHPHLCARPCLYFARGECVNGADCTFCHGEHGGRGRHLDKQGRDWFKRMAFTQRVELALPVLRQQLEHQGLGSEVACFLDTLEASARPPAGGNASTVRQPTASLRHKLVRSLAALSFRSILTHVCRGEDTPAWLQGEAVRAEVGRIAAGVLP